MGQFSWLDCENEERAILDDQPVKTYVLVPKEFREIYGLRIEEELYDGYGHFGGYDIHELVAIWNKKYLDIDNFIKNRKPKRENYSKNAEGDEYYKYAVIRFEDELQKLTDFKTLDMSQMAEKYGSDSDWLRVIGIDISCYDKENASLKYPIKITHDERAIYEDCLPSKSDPDQGWGTYYSNFDKDLRYMTYEECKEAYEDSGECDRILEEWMQDNFPWEFEEDFYEIGD